MAVLYLQRTSQCSLIIFWGQEVEHVKVLKKTILGDLRVVGADSVRICLGLKKYTE